MHERIFKMRSSSPPQIGGCHVPRFVQGCLRVVFSTHVLDYAREKKILVWRNWKMLTG
jgi:hypothetical protein